MDNTGQPVLSVAGIFQEYFKVEKWTIWTICAFYKKWSFFYETIYGPYCIVPEWSLSNIFKKKKTKKKQNSFCKKVATWDTQVATKLQRTTWFKLYFTHLIWIYLKFCQNRRYKWKHMYFYKNWSIFSKWTIRVKPYCLWLNFFFRFC